MKVIILAAGEGKRMWPITTDKCLIPFLGKPLLYHNLKKIKVALDPEQVIVVSNTNSKTEIQKILEELKIPGAIAPSFPPRVNSGRRYMLGEVFLQRWFLTRPGSPLGFPSSIT